MKLEKQTVVLKDGTCGETSQVNCKVGDVVTVALRDENGNPIKTTGEVDELLSNGETWVEGCMSRVQL